MMRQNQRQPRVTHPAKGDNSGKNYGQERQNANGCGESMNWTNALNGERESKQVRWSPPREQFQCTGMYKANTRCNNSVVASGGRCKINHVDDSFGSHAKTVHQPKQSYRNNDMGALIDTISSMRAEIASLRDAVNIGTLEVTQAIAVSEANVRTTVVDTSQRSTNVIFAEMRAIVEELKTANDNRMGSESTRVQVHVREDEDEDEDEGRSESYNNLDWASMVLQ